MLIHILPDQLASQIAAGEVVERPASVVKELIENALDAGATTINVEVRGGGRQLVQVADNGSGIGAAEVELAFTRHATSKLHSVEELAAIGTLGFRGEALAAIAAMSQVTLVSRAQGETAGTRLVLAGGQKVNREAVGAPQGTVIAIENLFYNTPARLKFLKSVTTDKRNVDELVTRYALAYPGVRFRLVHDGRVTFQSPGTGSFLDVMVAVYGPEIAGQVLEIGEEQGVRSEERGARSEERGGQGERGERGEIEVGGYVGPPSLHWGNRNHIVLFVNGRWIRDNSLTYAIVQAYHTLLPVGRFPLAVVLLAMPFEEVDVNVHPAKTEVRFRDANRIFGVAQRAVRQTLIADSPVRNLGIRFGGATGPATTWGSSFGHDFFDEVIGGESGTAAQVSFDLETAGDEEEVTEGGSRTAPTGDVSQSALPLGGGKLPIMRVVGQVGASYVIAEGPEGLFLIDQHAAHERILYEQFMAEWERSGQGIAAQGLVTGAAVHLAPSQATLLEANLEVIGRLGFAVEPFGPNAFMVRAVPSLVAHLDPAVALLTVVEALERGDTPLQPEIEARLIRRVCKTAAIKAGQTLSGVEMENLIRQLEMCQNPHTCPHGRPTLIHLSAAQLAREFGRS